MKRFFSFYLQSFHHLQRNVWIVSVASFINRSGSMVLLFTSLYLTNDLHFTIVQAGAVMSFYGIGSVAGSYAGGWLTDRKNFYDIMVWSLICSGLILLLMLVIKTAAAIAAVLFAFAFTADMFRPANAAAIAAYSTEANRTRSVSLMRLAINLGFSVGPAAGGFIALHLGYKWLFALDAITSFAAAVMLVMYLPKHKEMKKETHADVLNDRSTSAYKDARYLFFIVLVSVYAICFFQLFASVPQFFSKQCHFKDDTIGLLLALNGFLVVVIEMPLIAYLEKNKTIFRYIIRGTLCLPVAFLFLAFGNAMMIPALLYTLFMTLSEIFAMPFMMNYALSKPLKERQGQYAALYSIAYGIANILAPLIGLGIAGKYGFNPMLYVFIGLSILNAAGFAVIQHQEKENKPVLANQ